METKPGDTGFAYIFEGEVGFENDGKMQLNKQAILFQQGDFLKACAGGQRAHFVVVCGAPLKEPIAWGGPIVMNSKEEVERAFMQIRFGTFVEEQNY
jgi:redox-sensitive bicupin YhaK (pirin superfamily)